MVTYRLHKVLIVFLLLGAVVANSQPAQMPSLLAPNATPQLVSNQFGFTEGPSVDKSGNVYFTDQPNNKIWKYGTDGKLTVFLDSSGRANGMYIDKSGNLIACADEKNQLLSISPKGKVKVLVSDFKGKRLNGPNDVWVSPNGGIFFTDPYYQRNYWDRKTPDPELGGERVYFLPKGKTEPVVIDDSIKKPNGIVGTPDGKAIYVSDIGARKIYRYNLNKDGSVYNRVLFADELADGMTLDERGNLYLAGNGITIYHPSGRKIEQVKIPSRWTARSLLQWKEQGCAFYNRIRIDIYFTDGRERYQVVFCHKGTKAERYTKAFFVPLSALVPLWR